MKTVNSYLSLLLLIVINWGLLVGCSSNNPSSQTFNIKTPATNVVRAKNLTEAPPPALIQQLRQRLDNYQPQVTILNPQPETVFQDTAIEVKLNVKDLPIFKDEKLQMGPHVHLFLDNQLYRPVYNLDEPVLLTDLAAGTHSLRAIAARPWHETFKNDGAYAQTTFHIFTKTDDNRPDPTKPLLTYVRPQGNYGAEPILLDFYLTNTPLHLVAQENSDDNVVDWRIKVTIDGQSFILDDWQPVYLKGFSQGKNWIHLEFIDENGNPLKNAFNDTVRVIDYQTNGEDTLSKLVRGDIPLEVALAIVDPNYELPTVTSTTEESIPTPDTQLTPPTSEQVDQTPLTLPSNDIEPKTPQIETEIEILPEDTTTQPDIELETPSESTSTSPELLTPPVEEEIEIETISESKSPTLTDESENLETIPTQTTETEDTAKNLETPATSSTLVETTTTETTEVQEQITDSPTPITSETSQITEDQEVNLETPKEVASKPKWFESFLQRFSSKSNPYTSTDKPIDSPEVAPKVIESETVENDLELAPTESSIESNSEITDSVTNVQPEIEESNNEATVTESSLNSPE